MPREIANADLTEQDMPSPTAQWPQIGRFALTFDGYDEPRLCNLIANLMQERIVVKFQPELTAMRVSIASFNNADEVGRLLETLKNLIFS